MKNKDYDELTNDFQNLVDKYCGEEPNIDFDKRSQIAGPLFALSIHCAISGVGIDLKELTELKKQMSEGLDTSFDYFVKYLKEDKK